MFTLKTESRISKIVVNIHPANPSVRGPNHKHDGVGLLLPIVTMAFVFDLEDFSAIFAFVEVRVTGFELEVDSFSAGFTVPVFEFDFTVNAPIAVGCWAEDLACFASNTEGVAD